MPSPAAFGAQASWPRGKGGWELAKQQQQRQQGTGEEGTEGHRVGEMHLLQPETN